jgi:hypothetical protein
MRKIQLMALGALTEQPTGRCHPPFVPKAPGSYLVRRCSNCGNAVPHLDDPSVTGSVFTVEARARSTTP